MHETGQEAEVPDDAGLLREYGTLFAAASERLQQEQGVPGLTGDFFNPALGHEMRSFRRLAGWILFLQLTPWMLCRVLVPDAAQKMAMERLEKVLLPTLGPRISVTVLEETREAHAQYDARQGFFLVQPLVIGLAQYQTADQVFAAWTDVIQFRENVRRERSLTCRWQQDLTRREMFGSFRPGRGASTRGE
ncbi:MAG: [NiFe]-hydrogenase assembly chaperone HybE [Magnetococcus sp. DMHC-1]|nr:[NiFe]-hydrogenase assembly chaperone HybE [Magnetococcales bacterium]